MSVSRDEEALETTVVDTAFIAFQDPKEEAASLEQQRRHLDDQWVLLDLERAELEQQRDALQLQYALLDVLSSRLDWQGALLVSEAEGIRMTGKRPSPRLLKR